MVKAWHTWEHGTVQSFAVVRLWIVHENGDFTERSLEYYCYILCIQAAIFRPTTLRISYFAYPCQKIFVLKCCLL